MNNNNFTIHLYTLCYNEMDVLPFVIDYWKYLGITKAVVYDNGSNDGSVEFLSQFNWIEIRHFQTEGMNDTVQAEIKNKCWKETKDKDVDFVIVCDMDEIIFSTNLNEILEEMKTKDYNAMVSPLYGICEDFKPEHVDNVLLHTQCHKYYKQQMNRQYQDMSKIMLFDPNKIDDMRFAVGCHSANPIPKLKLLITDKAVTIHIDKGFGIQYQIEKRKIMNDNLSEENKKKHYCFQYGYTPEKITEMYINNQKSSTDINNTIIKKWMNEK